MTEESWGSLDTDFDETGSESSETNEPAATALTPDEIFGEHKSPFYADAPREKGPDVIGDAITAKMSIWDLARQFGAGALNEYAASHFASPDTSTAKGALAFVAGERLAQASQIARELETSERDKQAAEAELDDPEDRLSPVQAGLLELSSADFKLVSDAALNRDWTGLPRDLRPLAKSLVTGKGL